MSVSPPEWPSVYLKACMCLSETAVCLSYQYYYLYVCEYDQLCMSVCLLFYLSIYLPGIKRMKNSDDHEWYLSKQKEDNDNDEHNCRLLCVTELPVLS